CFQPFDGEIVVRIGKALTGFHRVRRLAVVVIAVPRRVGDPVEFFLERLKGRIVELRQETFLEFSLVELNTRHAFADADLGHGVPLTVGPWLTLMVATAFLARPWLALKRFRLEMTSTSAERDRATWLRYLGCATWASPSRPSPRRPP